MPAKLDYSLESDGLQMVEVRFVPGPEGSERAWKFMHGEQAQGSYFVSLIFSEDRDAGEVYHYYFTDPLTAFEFKLRFG